MSFFFLHIHSRIYTNTHSKPIKKSIQSCIRFHGWSKTQGQIILLDKLLLLLFFKSLWMKASAKCINVNENHRFHCTRYALWKIYFSRPTFLFKCSTKGSFMQFVMQHEFDTQLFWFIIHLQLFHKAFKSNLIKCTNKFKLVINNRNVD